MQILVRLVHAEAGARVVEAQAMEGERAVASALGEGATAEEAEARARERLGRQLAAAGTLPASQAGSAPAKELAPRPPELPRPAAPPPRTQSSQSSQPEPRLQAHAQPHAQPTILPPAESTTGPSSAAEEPQADPEDWSGELARIDVQLQRLGWQREQEATYLERAFGHPSRSRITTYADLAAYLQTLEMLGEPADPASVPVPLRRRDLLSQSDALLASLGWDAAKGRQFLEQQLGLASRQQLSDNQLLQFNMLLEEALLAEGALLAGGGLLA
ncbi:MAG: hypothetical protein VKM34_07335 [Cyanobacteriota bacterium]|nr:hypothetical protein [Cyanobacteriota bacterium]